MKGAWGLSAGLAVTLCALPVHAEAEHIVVGSKAFPESWILAEGATVVATGVGANADHAKNLGGTEITYAALASGQIDLYPEYTGTIAEVILHQPGLRSLDGLREALAALGIGMGDPLGFNDGYALAASSAAADKYRLRTLSDLARWADLRVGLTHI